MRTAILLQALLALSPALARASAPCTLAAGSLEVDVVADCGAAADGVHDDTEALARAADTLAALLSRGEHRGALYFPAGTYLTSRRITLIEPAGGHWAGVLVRGDGSSRSVIKARGAQGALLVELVQRPMIARIEIRSLGFLADGPGLGPAVEAAADGHGKFSGRSLVVKDAAVSGASPGSGFSDGVRNRLMYRTLLDRVSVTGVSGACFDLEDIYSPTLKDSRCSDARTGLRFTGNNPEGLFVTGNEFSKVDAGILVELQGMEPEMMISGNRIRSRKSGVVVMGKKLFSIAENAFSQEGEDSGYEDIRIGAGPSQPKVMKGIVSSNAFLPGAAEGRTMIRVLPGAKFVTVVKNSFSSTGTAVAFESRDQGVQILKVRKSSSGVETVSVTPPESCRAGPKTPFAYRSGPGCRLQDPPDGLDDVVPPALSDPAAAQVSSVSASLSWATGEPSDTRVEYGTSTAYGLLTERLEALTTAHLLVLEGLTPGTTYYWRALSDDEAGNSGLLAGPAFRTLAVRPELALGSAFGWIIRGESASLTWSSTGTVSCAASGAWGGAKAPRGSQSVSPVADSTYTLTCAGPGGSVARSVFVEVLSFSPRKLPTPEKAPLAMTFWGFTGVNGADEWEKRLEEQAPYAAIHAPATCASPRGCAAIAKVHARYPDKPVTYQAAWGGTVGIDKDAVWPGHWLYKAGTRLSRDVSADDTVLRVENPGRILKHMGEPVIDALPYGVMLYALDGRGRPDWSRAEHVVLKSRNADGTLSVERGRFGTAARAFKANEAVAAAHMYYWTNQWQLNLSMHCPRGGPGDLTAGEWYAREMARNLILADADGLEFDVARWTFGSPGNNTMDADNDLAADYGYIDGVNSFGIGGELFLRKLRALVGPDRFLQADGNSVMGGVRGWQYLNGVQLESFPRENDFDLFSEAFTHLRQWASEAGAAPRFSYGFTKTPTSRYSGDYLTGPSGNKVSTDFRFRVGLAAACMAGMPHPFRSLSDIACDPENPSDCAPNGEQQGIFKWDEYFGGTLNDWRWLGEPLGPARQDLGNLGKDLLSGAGWGWVVESGFRASHGDSGGIFFADVSGVPPNRHASELYSGVRLEPSRAPALVPGREYTAVFDARGDDSWTYRGESFDRLPRGVSVDGRIRSESGKRPSVPADSRWRTYRLSFTASTAAAQTPSFGVSEQIGRTELRGMRLLEGGAERWSREFSGGLVLLNMTREPWTAPLATGAFRRIQATLPPVPGVPEVNTGGRLGASVTVPARDAVFLVRTKALAISLASPDPLRGTAEVRAELRGTTAAARVEFAVDEVLRSSDSKAPYAWSWDTLEVADGTHTLSATAHCADGAQASTSAVVRVDNGPMTASVLSPSAGSSLKGVVSVKARASGPAPVESVEFVVDGRVRGVAAAAPYAWAWDTRLDKNGAHTLKVRSADAFGRSAAASVQVSVSNPEPSGPIAVSLSGGSGGQSNGETFLGANNLYWVDDDAAWSEKGMGALLGRLRFKTLRYPGGTAADNYDWENHRLERPDEFPYEAKTEAERLARLDFKEFLANARAAGVKDIFFVANVWGAFASTGSENANIRLHAEKAARWVKAVRDAGYHVPYWEIGNELYLGGHRLTAGRYADVLRAYYPRMKAADPSIRIGAIGPNEPDAVGGADEEARSSDRWWDVVAREAKGNFDFMATHRYRSARMREEGVVFEGPLTLKDEIGALKAYVSARAGSPLELALTEWNTPGGANDRMTDMEHALDIAEQLGNYSQGGVAHAEYWPFHIGGARFPVAAFNTMKPKSTFRLFEIFGEIRRDGACGADYDPRSGIYALCTRAGGEYGLWLVNRTDSAKTAVFSRPGKTLSLKSARVLTADGDDAVKVSTASASEAGESARVVLPPRSVGAVELYEGFGEVRLTAYPDAVAAGRGVRLRWESSGAASCEASGAWSGRRAASGSETVTPAAGSTYTLTCTLSGVTRSRSAFVEVLRMEDRELRLPDTFPVAMTFGAGGGISDAEFTLMLEKFAPYQVLHAPGGRDKAPRTRERWPEKPLTLQMAYGGANQGDFGRAWPGHWLYKVGTRLAKDAGPEDEIIFVEDPSRINGRIPKSTDTIPFGLILYPLDKDGKPDWDRAEHLVLTQRLAGGGLKVRRGAWGSVARSFKAGKAVAASHMLFWTNQWQLNLSLDCPRGGPQDLTAAEWYAQEVAKRVIESKSDGVEFDVGRWTWGFPEDAPMDIDNDLVPEYGYLGGVNSFGLGGQVLFRELRDQLGPNKIIQADSNDANFGVRGWKYLSGIQIECFPATDRFSEAFSHLRSWVENAGGGTRFSYPFTKAPTTTFSGDRNADGSSTDFRFRVGLAAACLTGMPHPFNSIDKIDFDPANPSDDETVVRRGPFAWDENFGGELKDWKWLGRPLGPARQDLSAMDPADLLAGASWKWAVDAGFSASNSEASGVYSSDVRRVPAGVIPKGDYWFGSRLEPAGGGPVLVPGREYTLEFEASGDDDWTYGGRRFERVPRSVSIRGPFLDNAKRPISVLADSRWRSYRISLTAGTEAVNGPVFGVSEQVGSTRLRAIRLHKGSAERWSREFERGLVLLNWTDRPWEVPLAAGAYRRLKGTQDPGVNDGRRLGARVVVPAKDALFLVKSDVPAEPAFSVDLFSPGPAAVLRGTVPVEARVSGSTAVLRVEFLVDGALESADAGEPFLWTWDTRGVANGTHTLAARAFDALGARASTSAVVSVDNPSLAWIPPGPTAFYIGRPAAAGRFLDDQTARFIAGRGGMLTLSGMYSSAAPAYGFQNDVLRMKRLAPALPVFFYTYASLYDQDWTVRTNAVQAKALQGYRDLGGLLLGSTDALIYGDVRKEGYRDWLAGRAAEMRDETRARGVSFDLARRVRCFKDLCDADAHYREAYGSGMDALFDAVRSTLSSGLVQMNGLWTFEPGMLQDQERLLEHADSSIVEYFGYQTNQGGILRSFQEGVLDYHEAARRHPDKVIAYFARGPWYSTATYMGYREDYLWQRYLYGAYLLGAAPNTLFKYHSSFQATSSLGRANGLDVYADGDLDLGAPLKPYSLENGLYVREFRKGLVLVAPHDGAAKQSKSLAGAYYDPEGSSVSGTLTLQRGSARILLKSKPAAPKPALVDFEGADAPGSDWEWARLAAESGDRFIRLSKAPAGSEEEHDLLLDPVRRLEPDPALRMRVRTSDPAAKILAYAEVDDAQRRQHRGVIVELSSAARGGPARAGEGSDYRIAMGEASRFETVIHPAPAPLAEGGWKEYELNGPAIIDAGGRFKFRRWMFLRPAGAMDLDDVEVGKPRVQLSLSADRVEVSSGQRVLLTWSSTGAASCHASGAWTGARALDGGETVAPAKSSTYTLACSGPGGRAEKSAFVAVTRFPPAAHSADWMRAGQIGLSSHYSASSPDQLEAKARALRVGEIAGQVSRAGASRYQFILHHQSKLMMAPNAAYDAILGRGGYASSRDVPLELYDALEERGIRLMLYVNLRFDPKSACPALVREKMGGWPPNDTLVKNLASVYREYSLRYGKRVSGWWVDGVQAGSEWGKSPDRERYFREIAEALRAGNPDAVVAFNPGLEMIRYSAENDFIAGESDDIGPLPAGPSLDGAQWHLWTFLGGWWGSGGKRFSDQELLEYARQTVSTGGALTLEVGTMGIVKRDKNDPGIVISTDAGRIDPAQVEQVRFVTQSMAALEVSISTPAAGASLSGRAAVAVRAVGHPGLARVDFLVDGVVRSSDTHPPYAWTWDTWSVADGTHTLGARAATTAGVWKTAQGVAVRVDNSAQGPSAYYLDSSSGDDANGGRSPSSPWRSIERANAHPFRPGDSLLFKRGGAWRGGLKINSDGVAVGAYGSGARPVLSGAVRVDPSLWKPHRGAVYSARVGSIPPPSQLFVDGVLHEAARYPHAGFRKVTADSPDNKSFIDSTLSLSAGQLAGADILARSNNWSIDLLKVSGFSNYTITTSSPLLRGTMKKGWGYVLRGKPWMLDAPGEWCYDKDSGNIYLWARGGDSPAAHEVEISRVASVVESVGRSNVAIKDLKIVRADAHGVHVQDGRGNKVAGVETSGGYLGVYVKSADSEVLDNSVSASLWGGVYVVGNNAVVKGNRIERVCDEGLPFMRPGLGGGAEGGIGLFIRGDNASVSGNAIARTGYNGMTLWGKNAGVQGNSVEDYLLKLDDGGGIYAWSPLSMGSRIAGNTVRNSTVTGNVEGTPSSGLLVSGIYLDSGDSVKTDISVEGNLVERAAFGILVHNAFGNSLRGNRVLDAGTGLRIAYDAAFPEARDTSLDQLVFGNVFEASSRAWGAWGTPYCVHGRSFRAPVERFGTRNDNLYCRPSDAGAVFEQDNVGSHSYLSLAAWRSASGEDMESTEKIGPCSASDAAPPIRPTVRLSTASIDGSVHLEWAAFNADSCRASGEWSGPRPAGGREALSGGGTYALSCSNDQGTVSRSVVVADTAPPSMSDPAVSAVFSASAAVRWSTDVPATGRVEYGTSPACGNSSPLAAALSTGHAVSLTGLAPSTTYYWRALSADAVGNLASAAGPAFRTLSPEAVRRVLGPFPVWAGHPVGFSIAESSGRQFLAFYDEHRRMSVAQRTLDSDEWTITALPRTVGWDSHNSLEMAIDDGGFIHLSGDMHADPLVYFRSARPLDARSLERVPGMTGANEARCTYPKFMRGPKNEFLFTYRDGSSGDGNQIYNVYDLKTRTWKRLLDKPLTDGQGARNAYFVGPVLGPDGFYHLSYVWREDPDAATNHDLSYARSKDLVHWETGSGKALSLPITLASGEIVDPVPVHGGLLNGHHRIGFDRQNRAVITYHKFDADGNTQIYNARLEGGRWKIHQTTRWDYRWDFSGGGSLVSEISAGAVAPEPDGGLGLSYSHAKYGSGVWRLDEEDFHVAGMIERPSSRPAGFEGVESDFPRMKVRWLSDEGASGVSSVTYWARWETLDSNRDRPRDPPWPEPSLLRVLRFDARDVPSVALSPWPGGVLHGTVTVRAAVSASTPVARVDFLVDDKLMAGDSRTPFAWAWDTFGAANGTHTLKARVHSVSGLHGSTSAVVRVGNSAPSVSLTAYPDAVALGRESALAWASTGAASCVASGGWSGPRAGSGRQFVAPAAGSTYTLTCWNPAGASTASAWVSVIRMEDRPVRMPESFPAAMTSGAGGGLRGEEFRRKLEELAPYAVLHAVGDEGKTSQARDRYPDKVLTQQMAYGGVSEAHFEAVWPGHWLYKAGTRLSKAVSVSDSVLFVQDPSRINGSIPKSTDTLPLCLILYALDERGLPDWDHAEHLVLVQRLPGGGLKVQRGRFASKPLAAASGRGVVAEHMPFSANQWQLNLSLHCPRGGPQNLTAAEWYAQEAAKRVISARSDGVEFDSGRWAWGRPEKNPMDVDNDLAPDYGYLRGVNSFGLGGQVLFRELRSQLGPGKIIQADSNDALYGARGWKYLSGVRLESFPASNDSERFSEAFEHLRLFAGNAEGAVRFSYPFTKAAGTYFSGDARGDGKFRSGLAAACLAGMPHPFNAIDDEAFDPEDPGGAETVVNRGPFAWDEYYGGDLKDWSWLGKPLGEPRRDSSALSSVNLLAEANWSWARDSGFEAVSSGGSGAYSSEVRRTPEGISPGENLWFGVRLEPSGRIPALVPGREYTLDFEARGGDSWEVEGQSFDRVPRSVMVRGPFASRSGRPVSVPADSVWRRHLVSVVASSEAVRGPVFGVSEQAGLTQLRNPRLREGGAERWSREFEHGLVLLNGTLQPWTVTVATNTYRRLKGSQDPEVNDGGRVGGRVVVPARDAAFLFKVPMPPELSLFASPGEVFPGGDALLVWASTAADACSASGAWTGARAASGSEAVALVLGSTYTLSCTGPGGGVSRSVFVSVSTGLGPPAGTAWVKAAPNPCVVEAGKTECSAAVSWDAGSVPEGRQAQVMAGGALFACGGKGVRAAPWIRPGRDYSFELRLATSCTASAGVLRLDSTTARGVPASAVPKPALGMNKFDLARQYLGTASGGDGSEAYRKLTQAMARKAIADARGMGARFLRVSASGYSPSDLELWRSSPSAYWGLMDRMMDDLAAEGVGCVPVFLWNAFQFPTLAGEGLDRMLTDPESASARLALGFAGGFIARYKRHPALYFYELTNELNLLADLDMVKRCQSPSEACHGFRAGNFTTDQMIAFTSRFAASLRGLDPDHLYSSGFSIPRPAAEHLRRKPEWVPPYGVDWTADSPSELAKNVADIHEGLDLVSAHLYNGGKGNERFGHAGHAEAGLLRELRDAAEGAGKRLYLGEFGDISPYLKDDPRGLFTQNALSKVVELGVPYASPWVLEMYYPTPYETYSAPPNYHNWEPGYTDLLIEKFKAANLGLGNGAPSGQAPPRVVLTWPLEGSVIVSTSQPLHAVASAGSRPAARVRFQVDGATLCVSTSPPFQCRLDARLLPRGAHVLEAAAFDEAGSSAAYRTPVSGGLLELSVALSTPLSGSVLRATVSVEARVSPSTAASRVDFLVDGVLQAGDAHGPFRWAWDTRKSPDGRHTLTARAYAGLSSLSASAVVEVDNSGADAPELSLRAEPGRIVRGRSSLLLWSSTGASSCLASGAWSGSKALSGSLAVSPAASSTYTLTCAGPGGSLARSAFLQVASDTAPPSVSILFPADRSVWSSTGPLMVSARVFDDAGVAWARLLAGGVPVSTRTQAPFDFAWEPPACGPGAHSLRVEAFDAAGNSGFDEVSVSLGLAGCAWVSVPSSGTEVRLGGAGLSLPAGALPEGATLRVMMEGLDDPSAVSRRLDKAKARGLSPAGEGIIADAGGVPLSAPVQLTMSIASPGTVPAGLSSSYGVYAWDEAAGDWSPLGTRTDPVSMTASAQSPVLSVFRVFSVPAMTNGAVGDIFVFPNPAKRTDPTVHVDCAGAESVEIKIYDFLGAKVNEATLTGAPNTTADRGHGPKPAYEYTWSPAGAASGVYFYSVRVRLQGQGEVRKSGKFALIR